MPKYLFAISRQETQSCMSAMRRRMSVIRAGLDVMMMFSIYVLCVVCPAVCSGGARLSVFGVGCEAVEELLCVEEQLRVAVWVGVVVVAYGLD